MVRREVGEIQLVKIQPDERLATTSELNSAPGGVIYHREARGMGCWAVTQVNGLSSEITIVSEADTVIFCGRQNSHNWYRRDYENPTESETIARYQKDFVGTRETQYIPEKVCDDKPENCKKLQMMYWESDKFIVAMKQSNVCGAKGLTRRSLEGDTTARLRTGLQLLTKSKPMTYSLEGKETFLKSRVREICKHGSVRGFTMSSM